MLEDKQWYTTVFWAVLLIRFTQILLFKHVQTLERAPATMRAMMNGVLSWLAATPLACTLDDQAQKLCKVVTVRWPGF